MNESPIILEGVTLMLLGMGFVFCFLTLLVGATRLLSAISIKLTPAQAPRTNTPSNPASDPSENDGNVVAAITAALHHHKNKLNQQA